ncbi:ABC-F family ATP-binding cassette domain-containing protein [Nostoc sp. UCD121]|uniref:ribosomal protection-like ABC-F family protein n=1 Tax=unclassified Nostoc TaxID=2593658 RepID=UPI00162A03CF|nr:MULTISPECIES: ABC-F family ATP-binding cassette domain-containing protein [unclassified Nostoc]MBC1222917.1 ABC-F family ATP-binding cassette domain-containing protein [Nostoc sp. UCD120]MBC1275280.1 ABC-F family ATP-binding cassette domain-containing protein [Nostoc sp. UCD121]MBC1294424.1 ABC-F family ATP-binding cassette domain-containing protein [Nostoc sp. UCD122]
MLRKLILLAENLAYELSLDRTLFQKIQVSIEAGNRIALVGCNGVGKSTLLKILAGQLNPSTGSVWRNGIVYYLPQISTIRQEITADTVLEFLISVSDEWWNIEEILQTQFHTILDLSLPITNLSGGELTKLFLAIGLSQQPNLLLLDEPTNHMDLQALESLRQFLQNFTGAFVIVSHKPFFLDQVTDVTWELTPDALKVYGGNFSQYREQKEIELEVALRSHEVARKELKRTQATAMQEQQRAAQSKHNGRAKFLNGSIDRMAAGLIKTKAEVSTGTAKKKHEAAVAKANQKVAETKVKTTKVTSIQLEEKNQKSRNLINIQGANLRVSERLLIQNIQLHVSSGDRISIIGANGSGKSSLVKAILGMENQAAVLESGEVLVAPAMKAVYLDQTYELVNRQYTILENMQAVNPNLSYQLLRQQLGHFLFKYDDVHKSASVLSGGELARLAIAMISISEIDLLILDEPTNNLDIETVEQMVVGINDYQGAIWVISHDLDFLSQINITQSFNLREQGLQITAYLPNTPEQYYQELLKCHDICYSRPV